MEKLSVVLATFNEEKHIKDCLQSVKDIADEVVVVDGTSTDKTRQIAKEQGARVIKTTNPRIFHLNKQKALDAAKHEWILQLDADERVTPELAKEIIKVINMDDVEIERYQERLPEKKLFNRHRKILEKRDGKIGQKSGEYAGFFIPRLNYFLGKYLRHGGVYPDGVIRLVKKGKAYFPCKSVHEQIVVEGRVGWLQTSLLHLADKTFSHYLKRNNMYINHLKEDLKRERIGKSPLRFVEYTFIKPIYWFLLTQIRHKGVLDGVQGIIFSFFSALRFPRAYWRYMFNSK